MNPIQPLLLTDGDSGGAGTATRRIHDGLREVGIDSQMLVRDRSSDDPNIEGPSTLASKAIAKMRPHFDSLPLKLYENTSVFSLSWLPERINHRVDELDPDLVQLNWIGNGFINIKSLSDIEVPIVWRLPDMWPMTGGCHYAGDCDKYQSACGACPQLGSDRPFDLSRLTIRRKQKALKDVDITVVAPSSWLASCAANSSLFSNSRIEVIPNGLDPSVFRPVDPELGRNMFDLPKDCNLVLFGSVGPLSDPRKGFEPLRKALSTLAKRQGVDLELVIFGTSEPEDPPDFGLPTHYVGYLNDEQSLSLLYASADVMTVPSRYEGFGQTVTEAMACGTPVVAFNATGPADTIIHQSTGYLADPYQPDDLAQGIEWVLADEKRRVELGEKARKRVVENYHYEDVASQYLSLYQELV